MWWLRPLGSILLACCTMMIGIEFAARFSRRARGLRSLISALRFLSTEILYQARPLPLALQHAGEARGGPVQAFFCGVAGDLRSRRTTLSSSWTQRLEALSAAIDAHLEERAALESLGQALGASDRQDQGHHLRLCMDRLRRAEEEARATELQSVRLWHSLSAAAALALLVLLI